MDFERVLSALLAGFRREHVRYGLIGGVALGALGVARATMDIDFLVDRGDLEGLHRLLTGLGYERVILTENVSHYSHHDADWGSVDILHAFRTYSLGMLARAEDHRVLGGTQTVKVLGPEDIIGLKIQAMVNDRRRRAQETADIEALARHYSRTIDWPRVMEFYQLFGLSSEGAELRERIEGAE